MASILTDNRVARWWDHATRVPKGSGAAAPWRLGRKQWARAALRTIDGAAADDFGIVASSIAFAAFLSLMPMLGLVTLGYSMLVPGDVVASNVDVLLGVLPGDAQNLVRDWLTNNLTRRDTDAAAVFLSAALTLFSARRAGLSLQRGINIASGIDQDRSTPYRQLASLAIVLALAGLLLTALVSITVLALLQTLVPDDLPGSAQVFRLLLWTSLTLGPFAALLLIYRHAPATNPIPWQWALPGTLAAVLLWIGATLAFQFYVSHLADYGSTYGSLSAVIVLQLWLMLSAFILLLGARFNAEAMRAAGALPW